MKLEFIDNEVNQSILLTEINPANFDKIPIGSIILIDVDNPNTPSIPWSEDFEFPPEGVMIETTLVGRTVNDGIPTIELEFEQYAIDGHSGSMRNSNNENRYYFYIDPRHGTIYV